MVSNGKRFIVSQMLSTENHDDVTLYNSMSDNEVEFLIILSKLISDLTKSQQKSFSEVLRQLNNLHVGDNRQAICKLPTSYADIRRVYTDGKYSLPKHLPTPDVKKCTGYIFVSLLDCVADFLLGNQRKLIELNNWDNYFSKCSMEYGSDIFQCKKAKNIVENARCRLHETKLDGTLPLVPLFIKFWSDDFDPNKSTKSNRQSVWIKTCTIFTLDHDGRKVQRTYPLSLFKKGSCHGNLDNEYKRDLDKLQYGRLLIMLSKAHQNFVYVHAELFCVLNDQPERRGNLDLANGNSAVHGRFGVLIDCKQVQDKLRSCPDCSKSIILEAKENCYKCIDTNNLVSQWNCFGNNMQLFLNILFFLSPMKKT
jgi:hypothetical protein